MYIYIYIPVCNTHSAKHCIARTKSADLSPCPCTVRPSTSKMATMASSKRKSQSVERDGDEPERQLPVAMSYVAIGGILSLLVAHTVFAGPVYHYMAATSGQLFAPEPYISTVLETPGKLSPREGED